jgi:uncharacterized protein
MTVAVHVMTKPIGPICNLDCQYCYYLEKEGLYPHGEEFGMSDAVLALYIRQYMAANPGPEYQFAWQGGEPTLLGVDFFRRAVALQRQLAPAGATCHNALQTNGVLLDDEWCSFLKQEGFLVGLSLDGPADLHDTYRVDKGGRPTHERVMSALTLLQRHGVEYNVLCVVNRLNAERPLDTYRFFKSCGIRWIQFIPLVEPTGGGAVTDRTVRGEQYGRFLTAIFDEWVRHDVGQVFVQTFEESLSVWAGYGASLCVFRETCGRALALEHNGDLYACDHFVDPAHHLGNINEVPLVELADSPEQVKFGLHKRDSLPKYCRECDVRFMCNGGCPKDRFIRTPDGEEGLHYLCSGYRQFFRHIGKPMRRMAALWHAGQHPAAIMALLAAEEKA